MAPVTDVYATLKPGNQNRGLMIQFGNTVFSGVGLTVTVVTRIETMIDVHCTEGEAYANTDLLYATLATGVTGVGVFTFTRAAGTTADLSFSYTMIGH